MWKRQLVSVNKGDCGYHFDLKKCKKHVTVSTALSFSKTQGDRGDPIKDEVNQDPTNHQRTLRTDEQTL